MKQWIVAAGLTFLMSGLISGQSAKRVIPRAADGHPDLQGVWSNATLTPVERPAQFMDKPTLSDTEAAVFEKRNIDDFNIDRRDGGPDADRSRAYNNLFMDRGSQLARVDGVKRTSLIIDPPSGTVPPLTPESRAKAGMRGRGFNRYDSVADRPLAERCLLGFGSTSGPPMLPVLYNNNYQIVQTSDAVMIMVEMVHDVRVVRMTGTHAPRNVRQWLGDSVGHWEGETLVVDTTNFTEDTRYRGSSPNLHVVERFSRVDAGTILYRVTIDDPATFSKQWTMEYPFLATSGPVYEYACHEGNYAMTDILGGARKEETESGRK